MIAYSQYDMANNQWCIYIRVLSWHCYNILIICGVDIKIFDAFICSFIEERGLMMGLQSSADDDDHDYYYSLRIWCPCVVMQELVLFWCHFTRHCVCLFVCPSRLLFSNNANKTLVTGFLSYFSVFEYLIMFTTDLFIPFYFAHSIHSFILAYPLFFFSLNCNAIDKRSSAYKYIKMWKSSFNSKQWHPIFAFRCDIMREHNHISMHFSYILFFYSIFLLLLFVNESVKNSFHPIFACIISLMEIRLVYFWIPWKSLQPIENAHTHEWDGLSGWWWRHSVAHRFHKYQ